MFRHRCLSTVLQACLTNYKSRLPKKVLMKTLVLGGTGFIGSYVVDRLLARGHEVRVFSRTPGKFRAPLPGIDYRLADFTDIPALIEALSGIDVVFHLISSTTPAASNQDPIFDIESNLVATVKLLQFIRDSSVRRVGRPFVGGYCLWSAGDVTNSRRASAPAHMLLRYRQRGGGKLPAHVSSTAWS